MKKLLFIAMLGTAGMMSARTVSDQSDLKFDSMAVVLRGYCTISVYQNNPDGTSTLIGI